MNTPLFLGSNNSFPISTTMTWLLPLCSFVIVRCSLIKANPDAFLNMRHNATASKMIDYYLHGNGQGKTFDLLADFTDKFGSRIAGSAILEQTIDYIVEKLKEDGLDNVHTEKAIVPKWIRGEEEAVLVLPRRKPLSILGLGSTVPTPSAGITAEAMVFTSFQELRLAGKKGKVKGKIVVFNQPWHSYGQSVAYRESGASQAANYGAVATLIRSAASHSIYSPHTGVQEYNAKIHPIPTACITVEDAQLLYRMQKRGQRLRIFLKMTSHPAGNATSRNTIAEITGSEKPNEVILISGHLDSWDVGQGAMDDGGGVAISWQTLRTLKALGLKPRRTIRAVFWTSEEQGHIGSWQYYLKHNKKSSNEKFVFVMESDMGAFKPKGLNFSGTTEAKSAMKNVINLLKPLGADQLWDLNDGGDVNPWIRNDGVPGAFFDPMVHDYYFRFHHTNADTMTVFDPSDLDYSAAFWTVISYTVADMNLTLSDL